MRRARDLLLTSKPGRPGRPGSMHAYQCGLLLGFPSFLSANMTHSNLVMDRGVMAYKPDRVGDGERGY